MASSTTKDPAAEAAETTCARFELTEPAKQLLQPGMKAGKFLALLVEKEHYKDAVRFVAHSLPFRQAAWWACLCVWDVVRDDPKKKEDAEAVHAVLQWVLQPSEDARRAAQVAALSAGMKSPAGALARAVFWSEGSMSHPGLPEVRPDDDVAPNALATSVLIASRAKGIKKAPEFSRQFLRFALEVSSGQLPWQLGGAKPGAK